MKYAKQDDWLEIRLGSIISDYDRRLLTILYQPLIGYTSLALYFTLWAEHDRKAYQEICTHENLFTFMQISASEFQKAKEKLEAVGLLRTYYREDKGISYFVYTLYAPKQPGDFFEDPLFSGLFEKYLGHIEATKIARTFTTNHDYSNLKEISASFSSVFLPDLDDPCYSKASTLAKGSKRKKVYGDVKCEFDFGTFFDVLKNKYGFASEKIFTAKERKEIERVATLFGLDGSSMADVVNRTYYRNEDGKAIFRLDLLKKYCQDELYFPSMGKVKGTKSQITSTSRIAKKIELLETMSCYEYLKIKQNMTEPVSSDIALIDRLSSKLKLPPSVINTLVDYVLDVKDNTLPASFTEKIGASLARANITNALDAMNFLNKKRYKKNEPTEVVSGEVQQEVIENDNQNDEDVDLDTLIRELQGE